MRQIKNAQLLLIEIHGTLLPQCFWLSGFNEGRFHHFSQKDGAALVP
ncbi:hypothetical protein IQ268_01965 [Oculatella sp. LEGE 06141]|nr:hypothetical protein [Oculatella sp. LEGE 06141]MBE9177339.1 hypothetical protein [Oculatella sp. LEGE 06141]